MPQAHFAAPCAGLADSDGDMAVTAEASRNTATVISTDRFGEFTPIS